MVSGSEGRQAMRSGSARQRPGGNSEDARDGRSWCEAFYWALLLMALSGAGQAIAEPQIEAQTEPGPPLLEPGPSQDLETPSPAPAPAPELNPGPVSEPGAASGPAPGPELVPRRELEGWADETRRLSTEVAAQSALLRQLLADLQRVLPQDPTADPSLGAVLESDAGATCRRQLAELSARLQQQQLSLTEAQRRAEKAEKLAAAMDQAQAQASTEIERLSAELEMAKARQAESLQHAVELERRLATAEARLARNGAEGTSAEVVSSSDVQVSGASPSPNPSPASLDRAGSARAPVLYQVRAADTLSRISARVYGDASAWERIYAANRDVLTTPDALSPGMSLVIP